MIYLEGSEEDKKKNNTENQEKPHKNGKHERKEEVKADSEDLNDRLLRLAAEFDNYKKRTAREIDASKGLGRAEVIAKLLPVIDEFELALDSMDKNDDRSKGVALIYSNFIGILKGFGLKEITTSGAFDPYKHEIMLVREADQPEGTILEVIRKGYLLNDIMLRPASVMVSKKHDTKEQENENKE